MRIDQQWTHRLLQDRLSEVMSQAVCMRVVNLLREKIANYHDVADALAADPFLSAKIVGVANLAQGRGRQPVRSIQRALAVLGVHHTHMLMMGIMLTGSLIGSGRNPSAFELTLRRWILSLGIAGDWLGSQLVPAAALLRSDESDIGTHLIGGLLKGLGPMLLHVGLGEEYRRLVGDPPSVLDLIHRERQILGAGHDQVTRWALQDMNCPAELLIGGLPNEDAELAALADRSVELIAAAICGVDRGRAEAWLGDGLSRIGVDSGLLDASLIDQLNARVDQLSRLLELPLAPAPSGSWQQQVMTAGRLMESLLVDQITTERQAAGNLHQVAVSEIARQVATLQADNDALTGVLNRRGVDRTVRTLRRQCKHPLGLILLDVDHFKRINDTLGHAGGDQILRRLGRIIHSIIPVPLLCGRLGGDEFVILIDAADQKSLAIVTDHIGHQARDGREGDPAFTLSMGALLGDASRLLSDWDNSIKQADAHLYQAKREGRDRAVIRAMADSSGSVDS